MVGASLVGCELGILLLELFIGDVVVDLVLLTFDVGVDRLSRLRQVGEQKGLQLS